MEKIEKVLNHYKKSVNENKKLEEHIIYNLENIDDMKEIIDNFRKKHNVSYKIYNQQIVIIISYLECLSILNFDGYIDYKEMIQILLDFFEYANLEDEEYVLLTKQEELATLKEVMNETLIKHLGVKNELF